MFLVLLLTLTAVLATSFLCSLTEAVLLSLNPLSLKLQEKKGSDVCGRWLRLKNQIERPVSAILVFNTLANTGLATLSKSRRSPRSSMRRMTASTAGSRWTT